MDYELGRRLMVERQLRGRGIYDERVLAAMGRIPREDFLPESVRHRAYADEPLPIGRGQTISQPYMTALMAQALQLTGPERVLEVGAGCGYHAAVLSELAAEVLAIELIPELADAARSNLERWTNVTVIAGDGSLGYALLAPYDAISVAAATSEIPPALLAQLKDQGRMTIPIGPPADQELLIVRRNGGIVEKHAAAFCRFVPLVTPVRN